MADETMRYVRAEGTGGPEVLSVDRMAVPQPQSGEVLIRVAAAGVNRPDVVQRQGHYPAPPGASPVLGLEVSGTVAALGDGVTGVAVGDPVCALLAGGGYAEYAVAPAGTCLPVPTGVDLVAAGGIPETFFTVWTNVFQRAALQPGEWFLVHGGSSGIGSTAIQLVHHLGSKVITTVGSDEKAAFCRGLGADHVINYRTEDFGKRIKEITGKGVDVVLDMVGGDYVERNIRSMAPDGRIVQIAYLQGSKVTVDLMPLMLKRLTLTGSTLRARPVEQKAAIAAEMKARAWPLLEAGKVQVAVHATFPLEQAADAHRLMESSEHMGKILLVP